MIKRIIKSLARRYSPTEEARRKRIIVAPPDIEDNRIVFLSSTDYSGNPKALFLYMIEQGYNEIYKFTWLFEKEENLIDFEIRNVESIPMFRKNGKRTLAAQKAIMSAKYVFYSHNVNWVKNFRKNQLFIDLWHGCGYKGRQESDNRIIYFDYLTVTGDMYIPIFKEFLNQPDANIITLGYPRNDMLRTRKSNAYCYLNDLKLKTGCSKVIMWMPTFRKSNVERLSTKIEIGEIGLPIITNLQCLQELDTICKSNRVLLVIKKHFLQSDYCLGDESHKLTNIIFLEDGELLKNNIDLYEFLGNTDSLLTDYSSIAIDYLLVDKPIGYTLVDYDEYEAARGFSFENVLEYMPGHHIYSMKDLNDYIVDISKNVDAYVSKRDKVKKEMAKESDCFSRDILDYFGIHK